jgi:8-oxo-dGTP diphosphatase
MVAAASTICRYIGTGPTGLRLSGVRQWLGSPEMSSLVRAAGGIVVRDGRLLLVHRPKYDDWSFPKGKLEGGETWGEGALREVEEETGLRCSLGEEVGRTQYAVQQGPKEVRYYRMTCDGEPHAQNEVDEVRWVALDDARDLLTHDRDRRLLERL